MSLSKCSPHPSWSKHDCHRWIPLQKITGIQIKMQNYKVQLPWIHTQNTPIIQAVKHCGRGTEGLHGPEDQDNCCETMCPSNIKKFDQHDCPM